MLAYNKIIEALLCDELSQFVPDGIAYSLPVPSQDAFGNLIDCFFLYDIDYQTGQAQPPYARIGIYAEHKQLAFYYTSKEFPFTAKEEPAHSAFILDFSEKDSQEYEHLYPEIRSAAFSKTIDTGARQLLSAYSHVATSLFGVQHQYYNDIAPAFFVWMNQMLQETMPSKNFLDACLDGDASLDDIDGYIQGIENEGQLQARLGMMESEFLAWKHYGNKVLRDVLFCRMNEQPFEYLTDEEKIAARSYDPKDIDKLKNEKS